MFLLYSNNHVKFSNLATYMHLTTHYTFLDMHVEYTSSEEAADAIKRNQTTEVLPLLECFKYSQKKNINFKVFLICLSKK